MHTNITFSEKIYLNSQHSKEMNKIALGNLDFSIKAKQLKEILQQHLLQATVHLFP